MNATMKKCLRCDKELENNRRKFCDHRCKYWYNSIKKDNEAHLPPVKKRNKNFFSMVVGYSNSLKGNSQGKRCNGTIRGSMSAILNVTTEVWAEVSCENIKKHFTAISFWRPKGIRLGDGTWVKEEDIERELNVMLD